MCRPVYFAWVFLAITALAFPSFLPSQEQAAASPPAQADGLAVSPHFGLEDVFSLEWASDPQISPDGSRIVYVRNFGDRMADRWRSNLWIVDAEGGDHRPLSTGDENDRSPRWSPSGDRLLYVTNRENGSQIWIRWMDSGVDAEITRLDRSPAGLTWSPDGEWIAFTMLVPEEHNPLDPGLPAPPEGADWGPPIKVIDAMTYRGDGEGYLEAGWRQLFIVPAEGGTPRQLTRGPHDHGGSPSWAPDGQSIFVSANRHPDAELDPLNSEIYEVSVADGAIRQLTDRQGPDADPAVSPDGRRIAFLGFDDRLQGYQVTHLYVMDSDGTNRRALAADLDRDIENPTWSRDGRGLFFQYDDEGDTKIGYVTLDGQVRTITERVGGTSIGRPYAGGSFSVARDGRIALTLADLLSPANVAVTSRGGEPTRLISLNEDLFANKPLGAVEEIWYESSRDGRRIQGWIVKPPDFDPARKYPLILEIHGGPFANYGSRFAAEMQLYAAAGYVVLYTNPRGSTSYGEEFGNLIHHAYPGDDYHDLISGVDATIAKGYIDPERLYVTGGSGGGVLTAWIVGTTDRFRAAAVQKPVINWYSFVLTADNPNFFYKYWFPGTPWENAEHYLARSPLSRVGNVSTPTLLITGEEDYRTPITESEQFYQALKLREVPTVMVRIPDASHGIFAKPSNLMAKVGYILGWFEKYGDAGDGGRVAGRGDKRPGR